MRQAQERKHTPEDLKIMQAWPLSRKIQVTQTRIMEWHERFNHKTAISFSGGVDSTVLLDLARRCYPDIPAVFMDTTIEYPEIVDFVKSKSNVTILKPQLCKICVNCAEGCFAKVIREHGICYPSKDVASVICYARQGKAWANNCLKGLNADGTRSWYKETMYKPWKFLLDSPFKISAKCCTVLKEKSLDKWYKEKGYVPIIGTLASESQRRKHAWLITGCNGFESKRKISKPLSFWTHNDILRYLRDFNIPYAADIYGEIVEDKKGKLRTTGEQRTGCSLCMVGCHLDKTNKFQRLKQHHPDIWDFGVNSLGLGEFFDFIGVNYRKECVFESEN
ncbi:MAG: phosphoadenosine phosphosulfate reductase family protein [Defluviitaleaceae bacterium]|nr:phosphoadenosine phosphosulfate reductase family protein [Defluviitaleaceae bacterium]